MARAVDEDELKSRDVAAHDIPPVGLSPDDISTIANRMAELEPGEFKKQMARIEHLQRRASGAHRRQLNEIIKRANHIRENDID